MRFSKQTWTHFQGCGLLIAGLTWGLGLGIQLTVYAINEWEWYGSTLKMLGIILVMVGAVTLLTAVMREQDQNKKA